jgi:hypothetical protein
VTAADQLPSKAGINLSATNLRLVRSNRSTLQAMSCHTSQCSDSW